MFSLCPAALQFLFSPQFGIDGSTRLFNFFPTLPTLILEITFILFSQTAVYFIFLLLVCLSNLPVYLSNLPVYFPHPPVYFIPQPVRFLYFIFQTACLFYFSNQPVYSKLLFHNYTIIPTYLSILIFPNLPTVIPDSPIVLFSYFLNQSL